MKKAGIVNISNTAVKLDLIMKNVSFIHTIMILIRVICIIVSSIIKNSNERIKKSSIQIHFQD